MSNRRIGVVGLGVMGRQLAAGLSTAGRDVLAHDVDPAAVARAAELPGVAAADTLAALVAGSDVVVLSLPNPHVVASVVDQLASTLRESSHTVTVLDTSTIDPETARTARERLVAVGAEYADCPILGRPESLGAWTIPVGGTAAVQQEAVDCLGPVARAVVPLGDVGTAVTLKLLNNLMLGTINAVTAEVLVLAEAAGLDPGLFVDTVAGSGAASVSPLFRDAAARAVDGEFDPVFTVALMHKDNALALDLADRLHIPVLTGRAAHTLNTWALAAGFGDEDSIAVLKALEQATGHTARRH